MVRSGRGDRDAWHALYIGHRDFVYATAFRFLGDEAAARDTAQDVFVSLFSHAKAYRPTASFSSYLRRITVNRCINEWASARNQRRQERPEPASIPDGGNVITIDADEVISGPLSLADARAPFVFVAGWHDPNRLTLCFVLSSSRDHAMTNEGNLDCIGSGRSLPALCML